MIAADTVLRNGKFIVPPPTRAEHRAGLKAFTAKINSRGVTSTLEPGRSTRSRPIWSCGGATR
jgi:hypothetical protein